MTEAGRLQDELRRALRGEAWHGPSLVEALSGVDVERAWQRPPGGGHTIAELVLHVASWARIVAQRLGGELTAAVPDSVDWPPADPLGPGVWSQLRQDVEAAFDELIAAVGRLGPTDWDAPATGSQWSRSALAHGVAQHTAYHAGQIALLRRRPGKGER